MTNHSELRISGALQARWFTLVVGLTVWCAALACRAGSRTLSFQTNDVVAFVGGSDVAAARHSGHLESLLAIHHRGMGVRLRNFGWEGDTVFEQPRDFGFPSLLSNLEKAGVTVVVLQFGRAEALSASRGVTEFRDAHGKLLDVFAPRFRKLILVTPVPFESGAGLLPDLSRRNGELAQYAQVIRDLAHGRGVAVIDLFGPLATNSLSRLTSDGLQMTPRGHARVAAVFARRAGLSDVPESKPNGEWSNAAWERVRQEVIAKNRLWFDYSRPQNWAFLGGDRTTQPSSRDHRDPKVRWFPKEMEKFLPLIAEVEQRIEAAAAKALP